MGMIYLVLLILLLIAVLAYYAAKQTQPRQFCPTCQSERVRRLAKEPVQVQRHPRESKRGVVIGSFRAHVRYELTYRCEACDAQWRYEISAPPDSS